MIDWTKVAELRDEIGAADFGEVVELFLAEVDEEMVGLRAGSSPDAIEVQLHFLRGSALNLGFHEFAQLCQQGEATAAAGRADSIDLRAIIASFDASKIQFEQGLPKLGA
jgi:HPt (histidine-containing phosphotransfer) domain-containing protein